MLWFCHGTYQQGREAPALWSRLRWRWFSPLKLYPARAPGEDLQIVMSAVMTVIDLLMPEEIVNYRCWVFCLSVVGEGRGSVQLPRLLLLIMRSQLVVCAFPDTAFLNPFLDLLNSLWSCKPFIDSLNMRVLQTIQLFTSTNADPNHSPIHIHVCALQIFHQFTDISVLPQTIHPFIYIYAQI